MIYIYISSPAKNINIQFRSLALLSANTSIVLCRDQELMKHLFAQHAGGFWGGEHTYIYIYDICVIIYIWYMCDYIYMSLYIYICHYIYMSLYIYMCTLYKIYTNACIYIYIYVCYCVYRIYIYVYLYYSIYILYIYWLFIYIFLSLFLALCLM